MIVRRDTSGELVGSGVLGRLEVEVLDGHTINGLSLITEGLGRQPVDGLNALDDEVTVLGRATVDVDSIGMLLNSLVIHNYFTPKSISNALITYSHRVLVTGSVQDVELLAGHVKVVVERQDAALVKVAVLNDLVNGEVLAELGNWQNVVLGLGLDLLVVDTAHVVPGLALTARSSLNRCNRVFSKISFLLFV